MSEGIKAIKKTASQRNKDRREKIFKKHRGICYLCGEPVDLENFTIDHVKPRSKGGGNTLKNLRPTHAECNNIKDDGAVLSKEDFKSYVIKVRKERKIRKKKRKIKGLIFKMLRFFQKFLSFYQKNTIFV